MLVITIGLVTLEARECCRVGLCRKAVSFCGLGLLGKSSVRDAESAALPIFSSPCWSCFLCWHGWGCCLPLLVLWFLLTAQAKHVVEPNLVQTEHLPSKLSLCSEVMYEFLLCPPQGESIPLFITSLFTSSFTLVAVRALLA